MAEMPDFNDEEWQERAEAANRSCIVALNALMAVAGDGVSQAQFQLDNGVVATVTIQRPKERKLNG